MMLARACTVDGRVVGPGHSPYVVAEMSANHNGSLERAYAILAAAKDVGCDAVKLQTYRPDTITLDVDGPGFVVEGGLWNGQRLFDLYKQAQTPWEWHEALFARGRELGLTIFSSPFDFSAVDLLESLDCPAYKIASFEVTDLPLIRRCAATGKPLVISTGMANADEIGEAVDAAHTGGAREIVLLHCVSGYPTPPDEMNLRTIPDLVQRFGVPVGLSDHTLGLTASIAAAALGAVLIERHFTMRRADGGPDSAFSLEPDEFRTLCTEVRSAFQALGTVDYGLKPSERGNAAYRRSLYAVADIAAGEIFTAANVRSVRPGFGLAPRELDAVLGRRARVAIARGTPLNWDLVA